MDSDDIHGGRLMGRSPAVFAVSIATFTLATIFVVLRMLSRAWVVRKVTPDDYFMVAAWFLAFGLTFCCCYSAAWGLGRHEVDIPSSWQPNLREANYAFTILYQPSLMAVKTSILAFYLTLPTSRRIFKWACLATLFVVLAGGVALTLLTVFQCSPVGAAYSVAPAVDAKCTDILTIYLSSAPLNIITDLAILFLPFPILTGMRLPNKTKIILVVTFSFGIFVAAVDVVRIAYLQDALEVRLQEIESEMHTIGRTQNSTDFSWYASFSFMWSVVEVNTGIMVACVPGLKPLVARFLPRLLKDPGEVTSKSISDTPSPVNIPDINVDDVVALPNEVHRRDFGSVAERTSPEASPEVEDGSMGMMEFLTGPEIHRTSTALTNTTRHTRLEAKNFFDFVNMGGKKSMVQMTNRESIFPIAMVTILFFIWGFEYGLLDVLNAAFQQIAGMSPAQGIGIHAAYFVGYFLGPLTVGRFVLQNWGFKACYTVGLAIYGCGTLIFWPAAVLTSLTAFIITNFLVGFGLSCLEVAANPFITLCGPPQYGEIRLNFSQGVQAIGSIVAPLIADRAFFQDISAPTLVNTQWAYLGISLATILLAVAYYYVPLPEATSSELEDASERFDSANTARIGSYRIIWLSLILGVLSMLFYVGAQEVLATLFESYVQILSPQYSTPNFLAIAHTTFAIGRFLAAFLGFFITPRYLLIFFYAGSILFTALAMNYSSSLGTAFLIIAFFMEGPIFALLYAQSLRGMGRHTKIASVFLTSAIGGGAILSPISNHLAFYTSRGVGFALVVGVVAFAVGIIYPVVCCLYRPLKQVVDPVWGSDLRTGSSSWPDAGANDASRRNSAVSSGDGEKSGSLRRASRKIGYLFVGGEKKRQMREEEEESGRRNDGQVEYQERRPSEPILNTHGLG